MASKQKTVHFFSVQINESRVTLSRILDDFFSQYGVEGTILNPEGNLNVNTSIVNYVDDSKEHYTIEKLQSEGNTYFLRLGKGRTSGSITKRNITTSNTESILNHGDEGVRYLQELTHLMIDAERNLIAYLGGIGGAKPYLLKCAINEKFKREIMDIFPVIEKGTLKKLSKNESLIDGLTFKFATPNPLALKEFGFNEEVIEKITRNGSVETTLTIRSKEKNSPLFPSNFPKYSLFKFLDNIFGRGDSVRATGKVNQGEKKREFSFDDLHFTEKVSVRFSEVVGEGGRERIFLDYEYSWECNNKMSEVFNLNCREELHRWVTQPDVE